MVAPHPVARVLIQAAAHPSAAGRGRAVRAQRADGAGARRGLINPSVGRGTLREERPGLPAEATTRVGRRVRDEIRVPELR